jgi:hypothetical protein
MEELRLKLETKKFTLLNIFIEEDTTLNFRYHYRPLFRRNVLPELKSQFQADIPVMPRLDSS